MATGTLEGSTIASTYKSLLKVKGGANTILDGDIQIIEDGDGVDSVLGLATDSALINGDGNRLYFYDADGDEHISADTSGVLSIAAGAEIDLTATAVDLNGTLDVSGAVGLASSSGATTIGSSNALNVSAAGTLSLTGGAPFHCYPYYSYLGSNNFLANGYGVYGSIGSSQAHTITITHDDIDVSCDPNTTFKSTWVYAEIIVGISYNSTTNAEYNALFRFKVANAHSNTYYSEELLGTTGSVGAWVAKSLSDASVAYTDTTITITVDNTSSSYENTSFFLTSGHGVISAAASAV